MKTRNRGWLRRALSVCGMLLSAPLPAGAPSPTALVRGADVARNVCSACHQVTADQPPRQLPAQAPSFSEIANRPDVSEKALRHFIATTHWDMKSLPPTMPNPMLTSAQVNDVTRYILSLRSAAPPSH